MSFLSDSIARSDMRRAGLMARRAEIIDAVYALFFDTRGQQIFQLAALSQIELERLQAEEANIDAQVANIDHQTSVYRDREEQKQLHERKLRRDQRRQEYGRVRKRQRRQLAPIEISLTEWNSSLGGAAPPWQWTWSDRSSYVPFSEMLPIPHFHSFK